MWKEKPSKQPEKRVHIGQEQRKEEKKQKINKDLNNQITIDYWQGKSQATKKVKISKQRWKQPTNNKMLAKARQERVHTGQESGSLEL